MKINSFSKKGRDKLVSTIFQLRKKLEQVSIDMEDNSEDEGVLKFLVDKLDKTSDALEEVENEYTQGLPVITTSRCPFSDKPFSLSIDTFGLNGPWWDFEQPVRAFEDETNTFFALTGSVKITDEPPEVPFSIKSGPAVPWVSPRLLNDENIIAVLSHLKIGDNDAYPIVYYSKDKSVEIERINTWGTDEYLAEDTEGFAILGSTYDDEEEYDFNIAPWIENGKLKWIDKDDKTLKLRNSIEDCPFLNISGYQYPVIIQNGTITNCMMTLEYDEEEVSEKKTKNISPKFCVNCGNSITMEMKFCANCGTKLTKI